MTAIVTQCHTSGSNTHCKLHAATLDELKRWSERLHVPVKNSVHDHVPHLDLTPHKRILALRYGAKGEEQGD